MTSSKSSVESSVKSSVSLAAPLDKARRARTQPLVGILLAAGQSTRMRGTNKLLLDVDGEPLVCRAARAMAAAPLASRIAVVGHDSGRVEASLAGLDFQVCFNSRFREGLLTSLQTALRAAPTHAAGYLVSLGDQPDLTGEHFTKLVDAFYSGPSSRALIAASYGSIRGHPVLIGAEYRSMILERSTNLDQGAKFLFQRFAERTIEVALGDDFMCRDIDTPEDYLSHQSRAISGAAKKESR